MILVVEMGGRVHEANYRHKREWAAVQALVGDAEARDRWDIVDAGRVGIGRGAAIRREHQSGLQLAQAHRQAQEGEARRRRDPHHLTT